MNLCVAKIHLFFLIFYMYFLISPTYSSAKSVFIKKSETKSPFHFLSIFAL